MFIHELIHPKNNSQLFLVDSLESFIQHINLIMPLINGLSDFTFFIKDTSAKYQLVSNHFLNRCNLKNINEIIGKEPDEIFDKELGFNYKLQDLHVMEQQKQMTNRLELHYYKDGIVGWCMTTKVPIINREKNVVGIAGISVDLQEEKFIKPELNSRLSAVLNYVEQNFNQSIAVQELATIANISISQLDRTFKDIFMMTPLQFIQKKRLEHAIHLLAQNVSITDISSQCGYTDHSAFSRKFKELTSLTPSQFKKQLVE